MLAPTPPVTEGVSRALASEGRSLFSPLPIPRSARTPWSPGPESSLLPASAIASRRGDPRPERFVEPSHHPLREALEQIPYRVVGGKAFRPQQCAQGPVRPQQRGVRPARRDRAPPHYRDQKRRECFAGIDGVRQFQMYRHMLAHLLAIADLPQKLDKHAQTPDPVRRDTALSVWRKSTFFSPQSGVISLCTVLFLLRLCLTTFNLTDWDRTVLLNFGIRVQPLSLRSGHIFGGNLLGGV